MVTRRAVLKGTAAASIGAIAAAHGATPAEAAFNFDVGFGQLEGGAIGGFYKRPDAFQIAYRFNKVAAEITFQEEATGGVAIFWKFFYKPQWTDISSDFLKDYSPDLKFSELHFSKVHTAGAELYIRDAVNQSQIFLKLDVSTDAVALEYNVESTD